MKILETITVPTGHIIIVQGDYGKLECLSLGDYGKDVNLKADFMGLTRPIKRVTHQKVMPLKDKWVITISSQYGCSSGCKFCDVPKVGAGMNASHQDIIDEIFAALSMHPRVHHTDRLNIHYARMGEPTWNFNVIKSARHMPEIIRERLGDSLIHPVVSTMLPKKNHFLKDFLESWMKIKNNTYQGNAGLQFSINSTSEIERNDMFSSNALSLTDVSDLAKTLPKPIGRKITLNFAVANYEIDAQKLRLLFNPKYFVVKLTPMHKTTTALENNIKTSGDYTTMYPYEKYEDDLKNAGFDVLVFVASDSEDLGRITCGNAILSGTKPLVPHTCRTY